MGIFTPLMVLKIRKNYCYCMNIAAMYMDLYEYY